MSNIDYSLLSNDEYLCLLHAEYIRQVTESGVPLWTLQYYGDVSVLPDRENPPQG